MHRCFIQSLITQINEHDKVDKIIFAAKSYLCGSKKSNKTLSSIVTVFKKH